MPKKESKIMSMLESRGVIRKVSSDEDVSVANTVDANTRNEPDIKALIDLPEGSTQSAARQPIPGMSTPVFPTEQTRGGSEGAGAEYESGELSGNTFEADLKETSFDVASPIPLPASPPVETQAPIAPPPSTTPPAAPSYSEPTVPGSVYSGLDAFNKEPSFAAEPAPKEVATRPDNYTDRYLNTEELYDALSLRSKKTESIYLIEEYLQTLPVALPDSARRDIVGKLLAASGFDYDLLMGDGVLRVKMLKEYAERFAQHTDDYIAARQAEVDEYEQLILRTRQLIDNRRELHKRQFYSIEAEAQRLKEILTFISG